MSVENDAWDGEGGDDEPEKEDTIEEAIRKIVQQKINLKPPKRNNVRRPPPLVAPVRQNPTLACDACHAPFVLCDDLRTGETVCSSCGVVSRTSRPDSFVVPGSVTVRSAVSARRNYFKERLSQWSQQEPPIPNAAKRMLIDAYDRLRLGGGPFRLSDELTKPEIRAIVIEAGLPPKNVVEKWLSVRTLLLNHAGLENKCPIPTEAVKAEMVRMFGELLRCWETHDWLKRGRMSLLNFNFMMCQFLLIIGVKEYELYSPWFPPVTKTKQEKLFEIWCNICRLLDWPIYTAEYDAEGKLHRRLQVVPAARVNVGKRKCEETPARKLKQKKLEECV